jgi:hypothetical protein
MGHTPGPWTIEYEVDDGNEYDDGVRIDSPEGPVAFNVIDCSAPLIAAAPELLAALKDAYDALDYAQAQVDSDADRWHLTGCRRKIKPVIDKAEGRSE